jgi:hypothetical protein
MYVEMERFIALIIDHEIQYLIWLPVMLSLIVYDASQCYTPMCNQSRTYGHCQISESSHKDVFPLEGCALKVLTISRHLLYINIAIVGV